MKFWERICSRSPSLTRTIALISKETSQMLRDPSTLTLGIVLPLMLLILFGYGLSFDIKDVRVTIVRETSSPVYRDIFHVFEASPYFKPSFSDSFHEAEKALKDNKTAVVVRKRAQESNEGEAVEIIVSGRDSSTARISQRFAEGALNQWAQNKNWNEQIFGENTQAPVTALPRIWYNTALESSHFLIPGVTVLIMTLIGTMLTSLVVAREWERGTYEAMVGTPVKRLEIIIGKIVPYFVLGMIGLSLCLLTAVYLFKVPLRASVFLIVLVSAVYIILSLGFGLFISALVKSQFLANQIVLVVSFMPTIMLSGFVFDLKSAPFAAYVIAHVFPTTWFVELLQTMFLVGDVSFIIARDTLVLLGFTILFLGLAYRNIEKSVE